MRTTSHSTIKLTKQKLFDVMGKSTKISPVSKRNGVKKEQYLELIMYQWNISLA